jgi:hypothetical protein
MKIAETTVKLVNDKSFNEILKQLLERVNK